MAAQERELAVPGLGQLEDHRHLANRDLGPEPRGKTAKGQVPPEGQGREPEAVGKRRGCGHSPSRRMRPVTTSFRSASRSSPTSPSPGARKRFDSRPCLLRYLFKEPPPPALRAPGRPPPTA